MIPFAQKFPFFSERRTDPLYDRFDARDTVVLRQDKGKDGLFRVLSEYMYPLAVFRRFRNGGNAAVFRKRKDLRVIAGKIEIFVKIRLIRIIAKDARFSALRENMARFVFGKDEKPFPVRAKAERLPAPERCRGVEKAVESDFPQSDPLLTIRNVLPFII